MICWHFIVCFKSTRRNDCVPTTENWKMFYVVSMLITHIAFLIFIKRDIIPQIHKLIIISIKTKCKKESVFSLWLWITNLIIFPLFPSFYWLLSFYQFFDIFIHVYNGHIHPSLILNLPLRSSHLPPNFLFFCSFICFNPLSLTSCRMCMGVGSSTGVWETSNDYNSGENWCSPSQHPSLPNSFSMKHDC